MSELNIEEIKQIKDSLTSLTVKENVQDAVIVNPVKEVESSLVTILRHRTAKLQSSLQFEELLRATAETRLSEASFPQLVDLLRTTQEGNSRAVEGLLAPIMASAAVSERLGSRPDRGADSVASDVYAKTDDKRVLQGLVALNQLLDIIKSKQASVVTAEIVPSTDQNDGSGS